MFTFNSIKELVNTLAWSKDLLEEMFQKRKSFVYKYDQAIEVIDETKVDSLISKEIIRKNDTFLEIDDRFLTFFENILEVNEVISTSYINENIQILKENINYYLQENVSSRKYSYLKIIKSILRKINRIIIRNILDLNRNIEDTFKTEPNYKIKIQKLKNFDKRRINIHTLTSQIFEIINGESEITFFKTAIDEELKEIITELKHALQEIRHNLIEIQKQIIEFLNQIKYQSKVVEKLRQLKYLKDQFEIKEKTNIVEILARNSDVFMETRTIYPTKLSIDRLNNDSSYEIIQSVNKKIRNVIKPKIKSAGKIDADYLNNNIANEIFINIDEIKNGFILSGMHLFDYVINYKYPKDMDLEDKVMVYCQIISNYDDEFLISNVYQEYKNIEYVIVYPK